jgi:hypothetical protein
MSEHDAAWAARIIARFTPEHIAATVKVGDFTDPEHERFLTRVLVERRSLLLRRYFAKLSPLADVSVDGAKLCAVDLARQTGVFAPSAFAYSALVRRGRGAPTYVRPSTEADGRVCLELPAGSRAAEAGVPDQSRDRYVVAGLTNGTGSGQLVLHLYDLGRERGLRLVGIERPSP